MYLKMCKTIRKPNSILFYLKVKSRLWQKNNQIANKRLKRNFSFLSFDIIYLILNLRKKSSNLLLKFSRYIQVMTLLHFSVKKN